MVYDITCRHKDIFPINSLADLANFEEFTPVTDDFEPELKLLVGRPSHFTPSKEITSTAAKTLLRKTMKAGCTTAIQGIFTTLHNLFNAASSGGRLHILGQDGLHARDYTLISLGMDTVDGQRPTRVVATNHYQYRERFSLPHDPNKPVDKYDACAKTLLSQVQGGDHRKEFEAACADRKRGYNIFRKKDNLPPFFYDLDPGSLYVEAVCMTSRASFFSLMKIPDHDVFALLEHCCDSNLFSTPNCDVIAGADNEWETEVKGFFGESPALASCQGQHKLINLCFREITTSFKAAVGNALHAHRVSKMERATWAVDDFYISNGPTQNRPPADIPQGIFHALTQRRRACDIVSNTALLYTLAEELPRAANLLHGVKMAKNSCCSAENFVPA